MNKKEYLEKLYEEIVKLNNEAIEAMVKEHDHTKAVIALKRAERLVKLYEAEEQTED